MVKRVAGLQYDAALSSMTSVNETGSECKYLALAYLKVLKKHVNIITTSLMSENRESL